MFYKLLKAQPSPANKHHWRDIVRPQSSAHWQNSTTLFCVTERRQCNHSYWRRRRRRIELAQRLAKKRVPFIRWRWFHHTNAQQPTTVSFLLSVFRRIDSSRCINTPSSCVARCSEWVKIERERWPKNDEWLIIWRAIRLTDDSRFHIGVARHARLPLTYRVVCLHLRTPRYTALFKLS